MNRYKAIIKFACLNAVAGILIGHQLAMAEDATLAIQEQQLMHAVQPRSLWIPSFDGTKIASLVFEPNPRIHPGPRPAVIFCNSWVLNEIEYAVPAAMLAHRGYVVLSYTTRGFGASSGQIEVAGPNDVRDVSALIDWLERNTAVQHGNIAMAGISYGAGMSLLGLAHDTRIKTAVALSGWGDLEKALYADDTLREIWLKMLIGSGQIVGRVSGEVLKQAKKLQERRDIDDVRRWAAIRSPITYIDAINRRQAPVFVMNSYQDNLFPPRQMREFYDKLTGPKMFYTDPGVHTSSQLGGLIGLPNEIWSDVYRWLDHWLLGIDNGIERLPPISMQTPNGRERFEEFPSIDSFVETLPLTPVNQTTVLGSGRSNDKFIVFSTRKDSGATTGIPILSDAASAHANLPIKQWLPALKRQYGAVYYTAQINRAYRLRGSPRVHVWLAPHSRPQELVVYLYEVDDYGVGTLITHGVITEHETRDQVGKVTVELNVNAYNISQGRRLAVAIDASDPVYQKTETSSRIALAHGKDTVTSLELPMTATVD